MTFDQLAVRAPTGKNTMLVQGEYLPNITRLRYMMRNYNLDGRHDFHKTLIFS